MLGTVWKQDGMISTRASKLMPVRFLEAASADDPIRERKNGNGVHELGQLSSWPSFLISGIEIPRCSQIVPPD